MEKKVLYTAFKPTGRLTLGNYIGCVKNIKQYENDYNTILCIADLHALTINLPKEELQDNSISMFAFFLAMGYNPDKIILYMQSHVPAHAECAWVLNNFTMFGEASRMTQFKDYQAKNGTNLNVGIFDYPVLMAADILLYDTDIVPVGIDQKQHVELARNIAVRFNNKCKNLFKIPEPMVSGSGAKIMGLIEPTKKMSKSEKGDTGTIFLEDDDATIMKKIKRAVTDSEGVVKYDPEKKPGVSNLLTIYACLKNISIRDAENHFREANYGTLKTEVANVVIETISPVREKFIALRKDEKYLFEEMKKGALKARALANKKLTSIYNSVGLVSRIED